MGPCNITELVFLLKIYLEEVKLFHRWDLSLEKASRSTHEPRRLGNALGYCLQSSLRLLFSSSLNFILSVRNSEPDTWLWRPMCIDKWTKSPVSGKLDLLDNLSQYPHVKRRSNACTTAMLIGLWVTFLEADSTTRSAIEWKIVGSCG